MHLPLAVAGRRAPVRRRLTVLAMVRFVQQRLPVVCPGQGMMGFYGDTLSDNVRELPSGQR